MYLFTSDRKEIVYFRRHSHYLPLISLGSHEIVGDIRVALFLEGWLEFLGATIRVIWWQIFCDYEGNDRPRGAVAAADAHVKSALDADEASREQAKLFQVGLLAERLSIAAGEGHEVMVEDTYRKIRGCSEKRRYG